MNDNKELKPHEMNNFMAEKVMKWKYVSYQGYYHEDDPVHQVCWYHDWNPYEILADAWLLVEKTDLLGGYSFERDGDDYVFGHHGEYGFDIWTEFVRAPTAPEAICKAVWKVMEEENE